MLSHNGIRAIFFDLDGTLRYNRPPASHTFFEYAQQLGVAAHPGSLQRSLRWVHYYWAQSPEMFADLAAHNMELSPAFWTQYAQRALGVIGADVETAASLAPEINRLMIEEYEPNVENWVPGEVFELLETLQRSGFSLAVISNRSKPFNEELKALKLHPYFPCVVAAGEVNAWKPDPLIFQPALAWAGVQPHEAIYVGDNYYADVLGAQNAGLLPILVDPDHIFPEATCPVIEAVSQLEGLRDHQHP